MLLAVLCLFFFAAIRIERLEPPEEWLLSEYDTRLEFRLSAKSDPELYREVAEWLSSIHWGAFDLTSYKPVLHLRSDKIDARFLKGVTAFATSSGGNAPMWSRSWSTSEADSRLSDRLRTVLHERGTRRDRFVPPIEDQQPLTHGNM